MSNKITFKIQITEQYIIKCSYIDSNNKEQEYLLSSSLIEKNSLIEFAEDLFTNPDDFKLYEIELYGKVSLQSSFCQ